MATRLVSPTVSFQSFQWIWQPQILPTRLKKLNVQPLHPPAASTPPTMQIHFHNFPRPDNGWRKTAAIKHTELQEKH